MTEKIAKHKRVFGKRSRRASLKMLAALSLLVGAASLQSCDKDILTGQPEWLGNSIYERLQEGIEVDGQTQTFATTLRLIDDLGYTETLSKTGSKTVFVASDSQYEKWFQNNSWGVSSYDQLTTAQKKQLFNGTMINNAYLLELMSNVPATSNSTDPEEGMCMRRETSSSVYDNVPVYKLDEFPKNDALADDPVNTAWSQVRSQGKDINILKDATAAPMIHFLPEFMKKNNITDNDLNVISNGESTSIQDSWINGKKVISSEQTCKNGYIYVISDVVESNPSMAEIINQKSETSEWASLLRRFSVPVAMSKSDQATFWRLYPQYENTDSIYNLRYLNQSGNHGLATPTGNVNDALNATGLLKFDPGWNQYVVDNNQVILQNDAAAMLVPTDEVLHDWFENNATGKKLKECFGSFDAIPLTTLAKLLNVNMLESFVASVPSKFSSILDDSQNSLNLSKDNIVKCYFGCNGIVYVTNKVFAPSEYSSVMFPALIRGDVTSTDHTFSVIYHALTGNCTSTQDLSKDFSPYLTAMDSRFSLIIPYNLYKPLDGSTNYKYFRYIDPCSYGLPKQTLMEFCFDKNHVVGKAYPCTIADDGTITVEVGKVKNIDLASVISNRLFDLIDNSIITEDLSQDKEYYKTKAGSVIRAFKNNGVQCFQGGYQLETGELVKVPAKDIFDMEHQSGENSYSSGNGVTYGVCNDAEADEKHMDLPLTASKSVYQVLKESSEKTGQSLFFNLIFDDNSSDGLYGTMDGTSYCVNPTENKNITLFDNYNYTVYVPTDAAIKEMIDNGYLPTWSDYDNATTDEEKNVIADRIHSFVRYHIQDNSVFVGGDKHIDEQYESSKLNNKNNRFYSLTVSQNGASLSVKDVLGETRHVITSGGMYNKACREYWMKFGDNVTISNLVNNTHNCTITSSSNVVVHQIDGVLLYSTSQKTRWNTYSSAKRVSCRHK